MDQSSFRSGPVIEEHELSMTDDYCYTYRGQPFTGCSVMKFEGALLHEYYYLAGATSGSCRDWDVDDKHLKTHAYYEGNSRHGVCQEWYWNGQRKSLSLYEHGIEVKGVMLDQFGNIVEQYILTDGDPLMLTLKRSRDIYSDKLPPVADPELQTALLHELNDLLGE